MSSEKTMRRRHVHIDEIIDDCKECPYGTGDDCKHPDADPLTNFIYDGSIPGWCPWEIAKPDPRHMTIQQIADVSDGQLNVDADGSLVCGCIHPMSGVDGVVVETAAKTGFDKYFDEKMKDPEFAREYHDAYMTEKRAEFERRIDELEKENKRLKDAIFAAQGGRDGDVLSIRSDSSFCAHYAL